MDWSLRDADLVAGVSAGIMLIAWIMYFLLAKKHLHDAYPDEFRKEVSPS